MKELNDIMEIQNLLEELMTLEDGELDEIEMLCGCTGKSCQSGWLSAY